MQDIKSTTEKHAPASQAIPMAMQIRQYGAEVDGYLGCHWTPSLGKYLPGITPKDTMVTNFGVKNQVVAL